MYKIRQFDEFNSRYSGVSVFEMIEFFGENLRDRLWRIPWCSIRVTIAPKMQNNYIFGEELYLLQNPFNMDWNRRGIGETMHWHEVKA